MKLTRTGPRTVASDAGWGVEEAFPYNLFYRQGEKVVRFSAEQTACGARASILLFDDDGAHRWQPPHEREILGESERREILVRVQASLCLLGIEADWQAIPPDTERSDWKEIRGEGRAAAAGRA